MADNSNWDTFSERKPHHDVGLLVEDRMFWVSRGFLAQHSPVYSPVFSAMFYGQRAARETIELPEKRDRDIMELLRCLIPTDGEVKEIDCDNMVVVFKLAEEYQIAVLIRRCTKFLESMKEGYEELITVFKDGIKFGHKTTVRACLPLIARFPMDELDSMMDGIPNEVRSAILHQKLGQARFHYGLDLVDTNFHGRLGKQCTLCGYFVSIDDTDFIDYSRCDTCEICHKKTQWQSNDVEVPAQNCCRCIDTRAMAELEKVNL